MKNAKTIGEVVKEAINRWVLANSEEAIEARVVGMLDKERDNVILAIAGLERDRFGRGLRISSNNSRSVVNSVVVETASEVVKRWIEENADLPTMTDDARKAIVERYKVIHSQRLNDYVYDLAENHAFRDGQILFDEQIKGVIGDVAEIKIQRNETDSVSLWSD